MMITVVALIGASVLIGLYARHIAGQLQEARDQIAEYRSGETVLEGMVTRLNREIKAHETSLTMLLREVDR